MVGGARGSESLIHSKGHNIIRLTENPYTGIRMHIREAMRHPKNAAYLSLIDIWSASPRSLYASFTLAYTSRMLLYVAGILYFRGIGYKMKQWRWCYVVVRCRKIGAKVAGRTTRQRHGARPKTCTPISMQYFRPESLKGSINLEMTLELHSCCVRNA